MSSDGTKPAPLTQCLASEYMVRVLHILYVATKPASYIHSCFRRHRGEVDGVAADGRVARALTGGGGGNKTEIWLLR